MLVNKQNLQKGEGLWQQSQEEASIWMETSKTVAKSICFVNKGITSPIPVHI